MANDKKILPYGISKFDRVRLRNYYYVDKTVYIRNPNIGKLGLQFKTEKFEMSEIVWYDIYYL